MIDNPDGSKDDVYFTHDGMYYYYQDYIGSKHYSEIVQVTFEGRKLLILTNLRYVKRKLNIHSR